MNKKITFIGISITLCIVILITMHPTIATSQEKTIDHTITIFVHGTSLAPKIIDQLPIKPLFHCPKGLTLAKDLPEDYDFYKRAKGFVDNNSNRYSFDRFYLFGWKSEKIYDSVRKEAAQDLVTALQKVVIDYHAQHEVQPKIRLIGHSHGGNVVLHTANYFPLLINNKKIDIEIWLIGVPVQKTNCDLINSEHFTKAYSIYSDTDWMQRMDPQALWNENIGFENFWSDRVFDENSKCIQVNFTVNGKSISHTYYRSLIEDFPLYQELIETKAENLNSGMIAVDFKK